MGFDYVVKVLVFTILLWPVFVFGCKSYLVTSSLFFVNSCSTVVILVFLQEEVSSSPSILPSFLESRGLLLVWMFAAFFLIVCAGCNPLDMRCVGIATLARSQGGKG